ncbi:MAG: dockerin type I repeat-containing protein [Prevotella sp.]|nr:dockerin type I repeat-containing protein [Prevotella sp.]
MAKDANGQTTPVVSNVFYKTYATASASITGYRYWFDNDVEHVQTIPYQSEALMLDVNSLDNGLHYLYLQATGSVQSPVVSRMFAKLPEISIGQNLHATLTINKKVYKETDMATTGGAAVWDIDVSDLPDGLHMAYVTLYTKQNVALSTYSSVFMKIPTGKSGIRKYEYWVNDENPVLGSVEMPECLDPYTLQALLPVTTHPIRSSSFEFRVEDGQPVIYAKNDIRIRFYDNRSRVTDVCKKFVDEKVKQAVSDFELLESGIQKTTARPADNTIKWYYVEAQRGDSLTFKLDYAATIQLFSPSGKELYSASGADALNFDGAYAPEDGTYYVALHDVTTMTGNSLSVVYQHIDKYALLKYTPKEIGVAESIVEMELDGNGFDKLVAAALRMGTSAITPSEIIVKSRSEALLRFTIDGTEEIGNYNLLLDFKDGDETGSLSINNAVNFATPELGDAKVDIVLSKIAARPYSVTIKVTNTGNVGLSFIPLNIAYDNADEIEKVDFQNFYIAISEAAYENGYSVLIKTDNFLGMDISANVMNLFLNYLGPKETKELTLGFTAPDHYRFKVYAWAGESLNKAISQESTEPTNIPSIMDYLNFAEGLNQEATPTKVKRRIERLIRVANIAQTVAENAATTGRIMGNISNGADHYSDMARLKQYNIDPSDPLYETIANLHPVQTPTQIFDDPNTASHHFLRLWEYKQQNTQNPNPTPDGQEVFIMNPGDPNDIFGYMAESGSKYVKQETTDVYYTIEFENDPEIATAAAHTIVVTDTLDATKFDLSSFAATSVKIGNKIMQLDGEKQFAKTMDLRPTWDVIAQVSLDYNEQEGTATWKIESLDPLTMEPILDATRGALPVNTDGNGQGELSFDIKLKSNLQDGDVINNYATITFDQEDPIATPIWTNIIDGTPPASNIKKVEIVDDVVNIQVAIEDNLSGAWRYNLYMQTEANGAWQRIGYSVPEDSTMSVKLEQDLTYGFYVVAKDSAGNIEQKEAQCEYAVSLLGATGDVNGDGAVNLTDAQWIVRSYVGRTPEGFVQSAADVNRDGSVNLSDAQKVVRIFVGKDN